MIAAITDILAISFLVLRIPSESTSPTRRDKSVAEPVDIMAVMAPMILDTGD